MFLFRFPIYGQLIQMTPVWIFAAPFSEMWWDALELALAFFSGNSLLVKSYLIINVVGSMQSILIEYAER